MQLDRIALRLRRRGSWEAIDLGCRMAQTWWRPLMAAWLTAYVPCAIALYLVFRSQPEWAVLLLWWLNPLFDRVALEVLSKAVFGEIPGPLAVLRAVRDSPGVIASLTVRRFDFARSFDLPVWHLERLRGRAARDRWRSLQRRDRGAAVWTTIVCFHLITVAVLAFGATIDFLTPPQYDSPFGLSAIFPGEEAPLWRQIFAALSQIAAVSIIEPFYVASGFALYLNRRTQLEAWDLELTLRGMAQAERDGVRRGAIAAVLVAALALAAWCPHDAIAASAEETAIKEVLSDKAFDTYKDIKRYRWRGKEDKPETPAEPAKSVALPFAEAGRVLMWLGAAALVVLLLYYARRYAAGWLPETAPRKAAPSVLFGLDVAPESLPPDLAGAALQAIEAGQSREALSLMYRAALSSLVTRDGLEVEAGDTEGDAVRRTSALVDADKTRVFADLVRAWQSTAYARRPPEPARLRDLWSAWRGQFARSEP